MQIKAIILIMASFCSVPKTIVISSKMTIGKYWKDRIFNYLFKTLLPFLKPGLNDK